MENTENRICTIKIKQVPHCVDIAMVILLIMTFGVSFTLGGSGEKGMSDLIIGLVIGVLFFCGIICCAVFRTKVTFGEGSIIKCQWLFLFWKIDLADYYAVTYTVGSHRTRGGGVSYTFYLMLYRGNQTNYKITDLREGLAVSVAEQCIRREFGSVQLMKLYRYIEAHNPEKAKGYE